MRNANLFAVIFFCKFSSFHIDILKSVNWKAVMKSYGIERKPRLGYDYEYFYLILSYFMFNPPRLISVFPDKKELFYTFIFPAKVELY